MARTRQRYARVQALVVQGKGIKPIMREFGLAKERSAGSSPPKRRGVAGHQPAGRPSILHQFKPFLHDRWRKATNAPDLFRELRGRAMGQSRLGLPLVALPPPEVHDITAWLPRHSDGLDADEQRKWKEILVGCRIWRPRRPYHGIRQLMTGRHGERLDARIEQVEHELPQLRSFAVGLKHDLAAVPNGTTLTTARHGGRCREPDHSVESDLSVHA